MAGAALLALAHGAAVLLAPLSPDELVVVDLGRLLRSACLGWVDIPWDQPPGAYLLSAALDGLGLPAVHAQRAVGAGVVIAAWAVIDRRLAMPARAGWFVACALSPALLGSASLAMAHSLTTGAAALLLVGLADRNRAWIAATLTVLVATSWAAWALVPVVGFVLLREERSARALAPLAPAILLGAAWLALTALQMDWVLARAGRATGRHGIPVVQALVSFVAGRRVHPGMMAAGGIALLVLGFLGAGLKDPLARAARDLAIGPWIVLIATAPLIWLGHDKFVLFLILPTLLLVALGAGAAWTSEHRAKPVGVVLACVLLVLLGMSGARFLRGIPHRHIPAAWVVEPLDWTCAEPFGPSNR